MLSTIFKHSRKFSSKIFVSGLHRDWNDHEVRSEFNSIGIVSNVQFVKSELGAYNG